MSFCLIVITKLNNTYYLQDIVFLLPLCVDFRWELPMQLIKKKIKKKAFDKRKEVSQAKKGYKS